MSDPSYDEKRRGIYPHLGVARPVVPRTDPPRVAVVVLNWNGGARTLDCLESLRRLRYPNTEILVVDNASRDGSPERIERTHPELTLIRNAANLGYAEGNNVGIRRALDRGAEHVLLFNNDAAASPDLVDELVAAADAVPDAGFFGAVVLWADRPDRIWYAGARWDPRRLRFELPDRGRALDEGIHGRIRETGYASGCALLVRAAVCREIGLMDPRYFLTWEEVDWCARARKAGWRSVVVGRARAWHHASASFGGPSSPMHHYFSDRNRLRYLRTHEGGAALRRALAGSLGALLAGLSPPRSERPAAHWKTRLQRVRRRAGKLRSRALEPRRVARALALRDFLLGRSGDCPPRVRRINADWAAGR